MQTATSETESKSLDLRICVHQYTPRAPCPKGQVIDEFPHVFVGRSVAMAPWSFHLFPTKAETRPPLEPNTYFFSPSPPQPTAKLAATQRGKRGVPDPPPPLVTTCTSRVPPRASPSPSAPARRSQAAPITSVLPHCVATDIVALHAPQRQLRPAAAAAVPAHTRGRWNAADNGWYAQEAPPHLNRRGGAHLPASATKGWSAPETLLHHRSPKWPPKTTGRHTPAKGDRGS